MKDKYTVATAQPVAVPSPQPFERQSKHVVAVYSLTVVEYMLPDDVIAAIHKASGDVPRKFDRPQRIILRNVIA